MNNTIPLIIKNAEENIKNSKITILNENVMNSINVLLNSLFAKNPREMKHSSRVSELSRNLAKYIEFDRYNMEKVRIAGLMHDVGKIGIPDNILDKKSSLTDVEMKQIKEHAIIGYRILSSSIEFAEISEIVLSHHERWDGKGYPRGISGENIPLILRIISIADTYDAMTSDRPYRRAFTSKEALNEIFDKFIKMMDEKNPIVS